MGHKKRQQEFDDGNGKISHQYNKTTTDDTKTPCICYRNQDFHEILRKSMKSQKCPEIS